MRLKQDSNPTAMASISAECLDLNEPFSFNVNSLSHSGSCDDSSEYNHSPSTIESKTSAPDDYRSIPSSSNRVTESSFSEPRRSDAISDRTSDSAYVDLKAVYTEDAFGGIINEDFVYTFKNNGEVPIQLNRENLGDLVPTVIAFINSVIDITILASYGVLVSGFEFTWFTMLHFSFTLLFIIMGLFWLNYKVHSVLFSIYLLFMNLSKLKCNGRYYSGAAVPDVLLGDQEFPHITIQIPIYKESLKNTLRPTFIHCIREAQRYKQETGAECNVVVCDDGLSVIDRISVQDRIAFYNQYGIGFSARPHPDKLRRNGRFKKAGNLNFAINLWEIISKVELGIEEAKHNTKGENIINYAAELKRLNSLGTLYGGDISVGEYILLIDSDTRLPDQPKDQSGCIKRLAKEMMFDGDKILYIQCYTGPYMSIKSSAEKSIFHHTCNIYNSIMIGTCHNSLAPLVGHNAFLNVKAMTAGAEMEAPTNENSYCNKLYWAEDRISEDFTLMMRGTQAGYHGRYATHAGVFLEGVSFSYLTEYLKIAKFAFGAAELLYNPLSQWCSKGVISRDMTSFMKSTEVEWYNKMHMLSYVLTFIAIALTPWALLYNLIFCEQMLTVIPIGVMPTSMLWEGIFVWMILNAGILFCFGYIRMGYNPWNLLKQSLRESLCLTCIYGSVGPKMFVMLVVHLFNLNMNFGATLKDERRVTLWDWIKTTRYEVAMFSFLIVAAIIRVLFFTAPENLGVVMYFGCVPLFWCVMCFWGGPIVFEFFNRSKDNSNAVDWDDENKMYDDKYKLTIPSTKVYLNQSISVPNSSARQNSEGQSSRGLLSAFSWKSNAVTPDTAQSDESNRFSVSSPGPENCSYSIQLNSPRTRMSTIPAAANSWKDRTKILLGQSPSVSPRGYVSSSPRISHRTVLPPKPMGDLRPVSTLDTATIEKEPMRPRTATHISDWSDETRSRGATQASIEDPEV